MVVAPFIAADRVAFIAAKAALVNPWQRGPRSIRWLPSSLSLVITCPKPSSSERAWFHGDATLLRQLLGALEAHGWWIGKDHQIERRAPRLSESHRQGAIGRLRLLAEHYPIGMKIEFYPDPHFDNPNGPRYGFRKVEAMDFLTQKRLEHARRTLVDVLLGLGFVDDGEPNLTDPFEIVEWRSRTSGHFKGEASITEPRRTEHYNDTSGDKTRLVNGQVCWWRGYDGRVRRGTVFHNLNNMWWIVAGGEVTNLASFQIFTRRPAELRRVVDLKVSTRRLKDNLESAAKEMKFERAIVLRDEMKRRLLGIADVQQAAL